MTVSSAPVALPPPQTDGLYQVMLVCTGNICRSAMARVVLCDRLAAVGVDRGPGGAARRAQHAVSRRVPVAGTSVVVWSAGTSDEEEGSPIDPRARRVLAEAGYTSPTASEAIAGHRAHRISDAEILGNDLLLAMTAHHWRELRRRGERLGADPSRVVMYRALDPEVSPQPGASPVSGTAAAPGAVPDLPDPWYGSVEDFTDTLQVVERVSDELAVRLRPWM
ncbi:low molecular weight phosphotyrosine protein phosphatase [Actinomyces sp. 2119]|uniref:protein-tyrosine-phosphatase n=1 Tax=Actinomyces lilanjuaniae TaxID=2321394 RepID=A0ABN5PVB3_9ACTO|nr:MULTISPECIES: low molecular weight phosphotyrosine protein phosphatase [Actinomyces]AYD91027.1 low molecular weight phosphotyrosine protein phosphatase [Actinomyces lilanjuaniae]RJF44099.1 low molecular weight phosphotyrosine protein phosphatase [Actinomyces sp. 2119]